MEKFSNRNNSENTSKKEEFLKAPEGWETNKFLASQFEIDKETSKKIAEESRHDHPEYFKEFKDRAGNIREHYSSELIKIIVDKIEKFNAIPKAPEGWMSVSRLKREWHVSHKTIEDISEKYKISNPEYFNFFKDDAGKITNHYSPELIEIIRQEINRISEAPEEWETNRHIADSLNVTSDATRKIANEYRESNPEYFKEFKIKKGQTHEHFHPKLFTIIKERIGDVLPAPEGWETNKKISQELKSSQQYISKLVNEYRESNPEYFKIFKDKSGKLREHYSPGLIAVIERSLSDQPEAPSGWMNTSQLANSLDVKFVMVQKIADSYCKTNSEYCKDFTNQKRVLCKYYSPQLVEIIKDEIKKFKDVPNAPEGWENNRALWIKFKSNAYATNKIADQYRQTNPEYFDFFKDRSGRVLEYYSLELVEIIKKKLEKNINIQEAPENWKTKEELSKELGISLEDINRAAAKLKKEFPDEFVKFKGKE